MEWYRSPIIKIISVGINDPFCLSKLKIILFLDTQYFYYLITNLDLISAKSNMNSVNISI
jgi:hypothetical protein